MIHTQQDELIDPLLQLEETRAAINKNFEGILIPVKILSGPDDGDIIINQYAVLHLPENTLNSTISQNIFRIQVIDSEKQKVDNVTDDINLNKISLETTSNDVEKNSEIKIKGDASQTAHEATTIRGSSAIFPHTGSMVRGFFVTKSFDAISSVTPITTYADNSFLNLTTIAFNYDTTTENLIDEISEIVPTTTDIYEETDFTTVDKIIENKTNYETTTTFFLTTLNDASSMTTLTNAKDNVMSDNVDRRTTTTESAISTSDKVLPRAKISESRERKPVKQLIIHRRPVIIPKENPLDLERIIIDAESTKKASADTQQQRKWSRKIVRKRPRVEEAIDDQNIAESQSQMTFVNHPIEEVSVIIMKKTNK